MQNSNFFKLKSYYEKKNEYWISLNELNSKTPKVSHMKQHGLTVFVLQDKVYKPMPYGLFKQTTKSMFLSLEEVFLNLGILLKLNKVNSYENI